MKILNKGVLIIKVKKSLFISFIFLIVISISFPSISFSSTYISHSEHYKLGVKYFDEGNYKEAILHLEQAVAQYEQAAYYRKLAEAYEADHQYQKASETYYKEADIYLKKGLLDAYLVQKSKGDALATNINLYMESNEQYIVNTNLAQYEPPNGVYIGAFVEYDSNIGTHNVDAFNDLTGKNHAIYYNYHEYGSTFPYNWAEHVKKQGAAVHISLEVNKGLDIVQDDKYLREFARMAKEAEVPIFLRFASEMNGDWVAWNGDPDKYIEKFRLVADVMHEEAPNVAMVWAPNSVPEKEITKYYPGDEWVDWVGVNLYSVSVFNGDPNQPADNVNPLDLLDFVYQEYADQKPIMVAEYAATHYSMAENKDQTDFAINKMNMLYQGVKLKYPRVKAINWYSVNNITHAHSEERKLNNFSLTENEEVLAAYKEIISDPYYLSEVVNGPLVEEQKSANSKLIPFENGIVLKEDTDFLGWIKTYDPYIQKVEYKVDGNLVSTTYQYPYAFTLGIDNLEIGEHELQVVVYDSNGTVASQQKYNFYAKEKISKSEPVEIRLRVNDTNVSVNGEPSKLTTTPYTKNGRTMVPLRFIGESLGADIQWDGSQQKITIVKNNKIELWVNNKDSYVDGKFYEIEVAPEIKDGTTFVPLRFITEQFGAEVNYNPNDQSIEIISD